MSAKILKFFWVIIIFSFIALQSYILFKTKYTDIVIGLFTVFIILLLIVSYWLIFRSVEKIKKQQNLIQEQKNIKKSTEKSIMDIDQVKELTTNKEEEQE